MTIEKTLPADSFTAILASVGSTPEEIAQAKEALMAHFDECFYNMDMPCHFDLMLGNEIVMLAREGATEATLIITPEVE